MTTHSPHDAEARLAALVEATAELLRGYGQPDPGRHIFNLKLDTTNLCNLQCKQCGVHLIRDVIEPAPMSTELLRRIAAQVFPYCADACFGSMAEPWMSPVVDEGLRLARAANVPNLTMTTNGLLLTEARARRLVELPLDRLSVSTDAATQETYARIRGGDLPTLVRNVGRVRDLKRELGSDRPEIRINFVVMRTNLHELPAAVDMAHRLGATRIDFSMPFLVRRLDLEGELPYGDPDRFDEMIARARSRMESLGLPIGPETLPETCASRRARGYASPAFTPTLPPAPEGRTHCLAPWTYVIIGPTGDVYPCCSPYVLGAPPLGNLREQTFAEILTGPHYERFRESLASGHLGDDCARCKATDFLDSCELNERYYHARGPRIPRAGTAAPDPAD